MLPKHIHSGQVEEKIKAAFPEQREAAEKKKPRLFERIAFFTPCLKSHVGIACPPTPSCHKSCISLEGKPIKSLPFQTSSPYVSYSPGGYLSRSRQACSLASEPVQPRSEAGSGAARRHRARRLACVPLPPHAEAHSSLVRRHQARSLAYEAPPSRPEAHSSLVRRH